MKFQPGQSGNPGGRPKLPEDIKEARKINQIEFERVVNKFLYMTEDGIKQLLKDPETNALELMLGNIALKALDSGDHVRLEFLLNRTIGKVKEQLDLGGTAPLMALNLDKETLLELSRAARNPTPEKEEG